MTGHVVAPDQEGPLQLESGLDQMTSKQDLSRLLPGSAFQLL